MEIEKIEAIKESLKKVIIAGKKISADGKVGYEDIAIIMAIIPEVPAIINSFKEIGLAFDQLKDVDVAEAIKLIESFHKAVKEIEAA